MATGSGSASGSPAKPDGNKRRNKKRIRAFTADERASHRVIEKQRREALNESFLDLARLIPALAPARRLSKSLIVLESIQHLKAQREMCLAAASEIQAILAENLELIAEVNSWREQYSGAGMTSRPVKIANDAVLALLKVGQETFGTFPGGFGDNGIGEEQDEDQGVNAGSRPQMEEQRDPVPSYFPPYAVTRTVSDAGLNLPADPSVYSFTGTQPVLAESNQLSQMIGMPHNFMDPSRMPTQQTISPDENLFSFLDNGFGVSQISHAGMPPPSSSFAQLNMHQGVFHDIIIAQPEMGYYLAPGNERPNF